MHRMTAGSARERANSTFAARSWAAASDLYARADAEQPLPPTQLEHWGLAAFLVGRDAESDAARERAHHAYLAAGDVDAAVRVAYWLGVTLVLRGERARGGGWFARLHSLLDDSGMSDSVWQVFLRVSAAMATLFGGDAAQAVALFTCIVSDADRFDDPDLFVLARNGLGQALVAAGDTAEGLRRLDEVMVVVTTSDAVSPQIVGLMYCAVIDTCRRSFDLDRAREWTDALSRWCAGQPELVAYRGQCLVHRAELLQLHGYWPDAFAEVERVAAQLQQYPGDVAAGMAHYQRGELHRLRGEHAKAEASYRMASRYGHDPQPGLALLRLAQGDTAAAYAALCRAVEDAPPTHDRLRLLPAYVEIALAAGVVDAAETAAAQLRSAASRHEVPLLTAAAAQAEGRLALANGDHRAAQRLLREALSTWQAVAAPYEAATCRAGLAEACRALGDDESAELELDAARWTFEQLGAGPDLTRVTALSRRATHRRAPGGLTAREAQILRMVATGATNRAIAAELFLSEKTVARHIANIFLKLEVTSRAAATAFAYEHQLV